MLSHCHLERTCPELITLSGIGLHSPDARIAPGTRNRGSREISSGTIRRERVRRRRRHHVRLGKTELWHHPFFEEDGVAAAPESRPDRASPPHCPCQSPSFRRRRFPWKDMEDSKH